VLRERIKGGEIMRTEQEIAWKAYEEAKGQADDAYEKAVAKADEAHGKAIDKAIDMAREVYKKEVNNEQSN